MQDAGRETFPTMIAPLYASSSATAAVRLRTKRPLMKKCCMMRLGGLPIGERYSLCTRTPPICNRPEAGSR